VAFVGDGELVVEAKVPQPEIAAPPAALKHPQDGHKFFHDGHCASGWMGGNTVQNTINDCEAECRSRKGCGFFAWAAGDRITHTNCAVYSLSGGCKDDDAFQGYKAYMISMPLVESRPTSRQCDIYKGDAGRTLGGESHSVVMALDFTDSKANAHQRQWILNIGQQGTGAEHWLYTPASGAIQFGVWNGPQISGVDVSRANHTLATVYDAPSKTYALFIDGKLAKTRSNVTFNIETSVLAAGDKQNFHSDANFNGCISGVDVYSYALTATQVQAVCTKLAVESAILPLWRSSSA